MTQNPAGLKIACIGCGSMGQAIMKAVLQAVPASGITVSGGSSGRAERFAREYGCIFAASNREAANAADIIFLGVKPAVIRTVIQETAPYLKGKTAISMAAGITTGQMNAYAGEENGIRFIRIMPNTPAAVGEGMIALCGADGITQDELNTVAGLLKAAGAVEIISESLMDCAGAVSGSGPAYAFIFLEALADAAVMLGMPRKQAYVFAAQTLKGAAAIVMESGEHPAVLKDTVCSPGGTTIAAVRKLEEGGLRAAVINAVHAAYIRTGELKRT